MFWFCTKKIFFQSNLSVLSQFRPNSDNLLPQQQSSGLANVFHSYICQHCNLNSNNSIGAHPSLFAFLATPPVDSDDQLCLTLISFGAFILFCLQQLLVLLQCSWQYIPHEWYSFLRTQYSCKASVNLQYAKIEISYMSCLPTMTRIIYLAEDRAEFYANK